MYIKQTYQPQLLRYSFFSLFFYFFPFSFIWVIILLAYFWRKRFLECLDRTHYITAFFWQNILCIKEWENVEFKIHPHKKVKHRFHLYLFYNYASLSDFRLSIQHIEMHSNIKRHTKALYVIQNRFCVTFI